MNVVVDYMVRMKSVYRSMPLLVEYMALSSAAIVTFMIAFIVLGISSITPSVMMSKTEYLEPSRTLRVSLKL